MVSTFPDSEQIALPLRKVFYSDCLETLNFLINEADEPSAENPAAGFHPHLSINTLEEYVRGSHSESETEVLEAHILACGFCALRAEEVQRCFALFKSVFATPNS